MSASPSTEALARAAAAMVREHDVTDVLQRLLSDAVSSLSARGGGVLLAAERSGLELLAATSHEARELELYQLQEHSGPCFDAVSTGDIVSATGRDEVIDRWGDVGRAVVAAGYDTVHAYPLRWRDEVLGAMNVFHLGDPDIDADELRRVGQAFADVATLVIVTPEELSNETLQRRAHEALAGRTVVEQAKGVIAYRDGIDVDVAFERLTELADQWGTTISDASRRVLDSAVRGSETY